MNLACELLVCWIICNYISDVVMRILTWCVLCSMLMPPSSCYLRGSLRSYAPLNILVLNDYSLCFTRTLGLHVSVRQTLTYGFLCVNIIFLHCTFQNPIEYSRGLNKDAFIPLLSSLYCGSIWMREKPISSFKKDILMQVKTTHNIHLSILEFTFFLAHPISCHQHGIVLSLKVNLIVVHVVPGA